MAENVLDKFRRLTVDAVSGRRESKPGKPQVIASERRSFRPKSEIRGRTTVTYDEREELDKETGMTKVIRRPMPGARPTDGYRRPTAPTPRPMPAPVGPTRGLGDTVRGISREDRTGGIGSRVSAMARSRMPIGRPGVLGSMKRGGKVKKTGTYRLHKGEQVVPLSSVRRVK